MKTQTRQILKGTARGGRQQVGFELKHRVVVALNKLADRDTYQVGVDDLEKVVESLTPEGISIFLSCILDTDSEQKSAVRKECIRLMGTLASFHEGYIGQHLGKIVTSIVKRLKDQDSVVRDACIETVGILASKLSSCEESDGIFLTLVKPLFEALGEQNRQVQSGSALCLARIIDNSQEPSISILQRMLTRTSKMLKNPHFMAKPAVIELNRSIIQAGGAPSPNILSDAMGSIQGALKNNDWITRKAASVALGDIVSTCGIFMGPFKASSIRSLESCRFDKVKPVRDTVLQALQCWRSFPGSNTPEPSETGSSIKENILCDYSDVTSASDSGRKSVGYKGLSRHSVKQRIPLSDRKTCQNYVKNSLDSKPNDWKIEIAVPTTGHTFLQDAHIEDSECGSVSKIIQRVSSDVTQDTAYEYVPMDDKQEYSSLSNGLSSKFETKFITVSHYCLDENSSTKPMKTRQSCLSDGIGHEEQISTELRDRQSLDSTVTVSSSQALRGCCLQTINEMTFIRQQLLEIQNKQSNLMDLLQMFTSSTVDSLSLVQSKVFALERAVDKIASDVVSGPRYDDAVSSKYLNKNQSVASPRPSSCTPKPSVDIRSRPSPLSSMKNAGIWEEKSCGGDRSSTSSKPDIETWKDTRTVKSMNPVRKDHLVGKCAPKNCRQEPGYGQIRKDDSIFASPRGSHIRQTGSENKISLWKRIKRFAFEGDFDSAYREALCSGDTVVLIELLDGTGPALESLSAKTASDLLTTLASYFLERRHMKTIIPWLQQASGTTDHNPRTRLSRLFWKARQEFLSAIREAVDMDFPNNVDRRAVTKLAIELHQAWGKKAFEEAVNCWLNIKKTSIHFTKSPDA